MEEANEQRKKSSSRRHKGDHSKHHKHSTRDPEPQPEQDETPEDNPSVGESQPSLILPVEDFSLAEVSIDAERFTSAEHAKGFFREHKKGSIFKKKTLSFDELMSYTDDKITEPLLLTIPKQKIKAAVAMFQNLQMYTGSRKPKGDKVSLLQLIIDGVMDSQQMRDELYMQVIKQIRGCPNQDILRTTLELLLILCSMMPISQNYENFVIATIIQTARQNPEYQELLTLSFLRFQSTSAREEFQPLTASKALTIPRSPRGYPQVFCSSIQEYMWAQHTTMPNLPVPLPLVVLSNHIIDLGGLGMEGLFRINGSARQVDNVIATCDYTFKALQGRTAHEHANLMKRWFGCLTFSVIPEELAMDFINACEGDRFMEFYERLPLPNRNILAYLACFLKHCSTAFNVTKMSVDNLAMCFSPNMLKMTGGDCRDATRITGHSKSFLAFLIVHMGDQGLFPMDTSLYQIPESI